jgi:hypothetical protein
VDDQGTIETRIIAAEGNPAPDFGPGAVFTEMGFNAVALAFPYGPGIGSAVTQWEVSTVGDVVIEDHEDNSRSILFTSQDPAPAPFAGQLGRIELFDRALDGTLLLYSAVGEDERVLRYTPGEGLRGVLATGDAVFAADGVTTAGIVSGISSFYGALSPNGRATIAVEFNDDGIKRVVVQDDDERFRLAAVMNAPIARSTGLPGVGHLGIFSAWGVNDNGVALLSNGPLSLGVYDPMQGAALAVEAGMSIAVAPDDMRTVTQAWTLSLRHQPTLAGEFVCLVNFDDGSSGLVKVSLVADCPGDTNGDNIVNFADLNAVLSAFGQSGVGLPADLNGDGMVNFADLNAVLSAFGSACD